MTLGTIIQPPKPYSLVKLEIVTSGGISSYHLFVSRTDNERIEYKLGRSATCDIVIS